MIDFKMRSRYILPLVLSLVVVSAEMGNFFDGFLSRIKRSDVIPNQYIIEFQQNADFEEVLSKIVSIANRQAEAPSVLFRYNEIMNGVAMKGLTKETAALLAQDPGIVKVTEVCSLFCSHNVYTLFFFRSRTDDDNNVVVDDDFIQDMIARKAAVTEQKDVPSWGLDRIDQRDRSPGDKTYRYSRTGLGVKVFVFDTGIKSTHPDFGGRVTCGFNGYAETEDCNDGDGHGTHVSGTIGGTQYGVAKQVDLVTVKALANNGTGTGSVFLAGIDYVIAQKRASPSTPMVVNMSLGFGKTFPEIDDKVKLLVAEGVVTVVAAGNSYRNACLGSPASARGGIISVAASTVRDRQAWYSNFGECVDIFAPGSDIVSANFQSDTTPATGSGTSMASPHVAGAAALYLQANPMWSPAQVWTAMQNDATPKKVRCRRLFSNTPNLLLSTVSIT